MKATDKKIQKSNNKTSKSVIRFDWAIKHLLRNKANFDVLEGFLAALLKQNIKLLKILESEGNQSDEKMKFNRVDMLVEDESGKKIIIEVQNETESDYLYRLLYGTSKVITDYLELGQPYKNVSKVISISILYFKIIGDDYLYYGNTEFKGIHTGNALSITEKYMDKTLEKARTITSDAIYPEYYLIDVNKFSDIIKDDVDEWIYMFKNNKVEAKFSSKNIQKAAEKLNILKMEKESRRVYERYLMSIASEVDVLETAKKEALEKGEQIGLEKGKIEGKIEDARLMKKEGLSVDIISRVTGLSIQDIEKL